MQRVYEHYFKTSSVISCDPKEARMGALKQYLFIYITDCLVARLIYRKAKYEARACKMHLPASIYK